MSFKNYLLFFIEYEENGNTFIDYSYCYKEKHFFIITLHLFLSHYVRVIYQVENKKNKEFIQSGLRWLQHSPYNVEAIYQ